MIRSQQTRPWLLVAVLLSLSAAAPDWKQQALAAAAPFIDKANDDWNRAIVNGDADSLSAPYDEKGLFVGPDGSTVQGRDAVRTMYATRPQTVQVLSARIQSEGRAAASPDDVYEWGSATMQLKRDGLLKTATGRYLTVWHREGAEWRITRNIAF